MTQRILNLFLLYNSRKHISILYDSVVGLTEITIRQANVDSILAERIEELKSNGTTK